MSLLDTLRDWLFGGDDESTEGGETKASSASETDATEADDDQRLDPGNVKKVRTSADDDPVEQLRELDQERADDDRAGASDGESESEPAPGTEEESGAGG
ncbi:MAG: hypothetical protein ABEJ79_02710 [Halolamina sp.]